MNRQSRNKTQQQVRRLTVSVMGDSWRGTDQPHMRFGGAWLRRAGFAPSDKYVIRVLDQGRLVIEKAEHYG